MNIPISQIISILIVEAVLVYGSTKHLTYTNWIGQTFSTHLTIIQNFFPLFVAGQFAVCLFGVRLYLAS